MEEEAGVAQPGSCIGLDIQVELPYSIYMSGPKKSYTKEQIVNAVKDSVTIAQVIRKLGLITAGGNYESVKRYIQELDLDTSHFLGSRWRKGCTTPVVPPRPLSKILKKGTTYNSNRLRKRLIQEGLKRAVCETCNRTTWQGSSIPLELEHKNGDRSDNRLENLSIICPNCHALTPFYRGRNIGRLAPNR